MLYFGGISEGIGERVLFLGGFTWSGSCPCTRTICGYVVDSYKKYCCFWRIQKARKHAFAREHNQTLAAGFRRALAALLVILALAGCAPPSDQPEPGPVVFVGDSITHLWVGLDGVNAGVNGQTAAEMAVRLDDVLALNPSTIVILGGTNDLMLGDTNTASLVSMADRAASKGITVILGTVPPQPEPPVLGPADLNERIRVWNDEVRAIARAYGYRLADYYPALVDANGLQDSSLFADFVHPNADGYARMCDVLNATARERLCE